MQHHPLNLPLFSPDTCAISPMKICLSEHQGHFSINVAGTRNPPGHKVPRVCENSFHQELWPWFRMGLKFTILRGWLQCAVQGQGCRWTKTSWGIPPPAAGHYWSHPWVWESPMLCQESVLEGLKLSFVKAPCMAEVRIEVRWEN